MLRLLRIKNLALIDDLSWELEEGLTVLTGETGAGKSILIDAFQLLLGERADRNLIREGSDQCRVEAVFDQMGAMDPDLEALGLEPCDEGELIFKRVIDKEKSSRQFINGSPVTVQHLKKLTNDLVDFHGPHDHQALLSERSQISALDAYASAGKILLAYQETYRGWLQEKDKLDDLLGQSVEGSEQRLEFVTEQIREIEEAALRPGEDEEVEQAFRVASSAKEIVQLGGEMNRLIEEEGGGIEDQHARLHQLLSNWLSYDPTMEDELGRHTEIVNLIEDLKRQVSQRVEKVEMDEAELSDLEARLNLIQSLKRKYGRSIEEIDAKYNQLVEEKERLANRDELIREAEAKIAVLEKAANEKAADLTQHRETQAVKLAKSITKELKGLGFAQSLFEVKLSRRTTLSSSGKDHVEFCFAPNPGEGLRALAAIASSGEMARVMLAVKTVLAETDEIPVLIFDEVDANVGGETATRVAARLKALGHGRQVLCITHLPQVAAAGKQHFQVEKSVTKGRTKTRVELIEDDERLSELARMLGGQNESSLGLAKNLIASFD
ncbi:MAG: DNA repair protein RecN [Verrucomicrobiota bacterium]